MDERIRTIRISIDKIREKMGSLSGRELARRAGLSATALYEVFNTRTASWETLQRIAGALDVEPQELAVDDVSGYGLSYIPDICDEGYHLLVEGIVKAAIADYKKSYRAVLRGKDPDGIESGNMRSCIRAIRYWAPEADGIEEHLQREVEQGEVRRKKVFGRDKDVPASR